MADGATAEVFLGERRVGVLTFSTEVTEFRYQDSEIGHPVLGQAFETRPEDVRRARTAVPDWFENLLPERGGALRGFVAERIGVSSQRSFPLLVHLGADLPGAVRVVGTDLPEEAADQHDDGERRAMLRFSLAGVQLKFSMARTGRGLTLPMSGTGGDSIVKLPDRRHPAVPENEFTMLRWAATAGIAVPEHDLVPGHDLDGLPAGLIRPGERALAVRRFDRPDGGGRVHMEDLAQVREVAPHEKYDGTSYDAIARLLQELTPDDLDEYLRRLVALVLMGNADAHLKNWTLLYPDERTPRLSPAYDLVNVTFYDAYAQDRLAFRIGREKVFERVTRGHFAVLAERADLAEDHVLAVVDSSVDALRAAWPEVRAESPAPPELLAHVDDRLRTLPLARSRETA